ncbi:unnamed protein product [Darwinula stevensoni]|uniref:Uncharacterized protein n=1 Tax=Darwinula stevensoni TaxID=69355 RepID=A0A7R8X4M7_9CRUS|nr:unnamed protein product [Darwinula stevensoni]CAG0879171.1 unnamed protein product [Darwinula stevensoni]
MGRPEGKDEEKEALLTVQAKSGQAMRTKPRECNSYRDDPAEMKDGGRNSHSPVPVPSPSTHPFPPPTFQTPLGIPYQLIISGSAIDMK